MGHITKKKNYINISQIFLMVGLIILVAWFVFPLASITSLSDNLVIPLIIIVVSFALFWIFLKKARDL
jgi:Zn-dependent protease with chaperone function